MTWPITAELRKTLRELFPVRRDRRVVWGLVALAAVVSITELAAVQLFSLLILPQSDRSQSSTVLLVLLFFGVFGGLRLVNYAREMYKLNVFERALTESVGGAQAQDSWRWAMAMEVTNILSAVCRAIVVVVACLVLAPWFGLGVLIVVALFGAMLSSMFTRQLVTQRDFRAAQLARSPVSNATKLRTRVKAGELGSLVGHLGIVLLVGLLVALTLNEQVPPGTAFVIFVALRMLGQIMSEITKMLLRYVRARAFSE